MVKVSNFNINILRTRAMRKAGMVSLIALVLMGLGIIMPIARNSKTEAQQGQAAASTTTLTITNANTTAAVDLSVVSSNGTFAASGTDVSVGVKTTNATGYNLSLAPKTAGSTDLTSDTKNETSNSYATFTTLGGNIAKNTFAADTATAGDTYNGRWGVKPSVYYNSTTSTTMDNSMTNGNELYMPGTAMTMTNTACANGKGDDCPSEDSYSIGIGARAAYTQAAGTYTNTYVLSATGNATTYTIVYGDNTGDSGVSNMPYTSAETGGANNGKQSGSQTTTSVTLSSVVPKRTGYTFYKWCLGTVTHNNRSDSATGLDACSGTEFAAGAAFGLDQTVDNSDVKLYAMWQGNQYTMRVYYNSNATSGSTSVTSATASCYVANNNNNCSATIPTGATGSVGTYNNAYAGLASSTGTMNNATDAASTTLDSSKTTATITGTNSGDTTTYYTVYRTGVTLYKPSSQTARTSVSLYRNQWFADASTMATTVLASSNTGTSNYTYSALAAVSGTNPGYTLYGFSTNGTATKSYDAISNIAATNGITFYGIEYVTISTTYYYNNNTATGSCKTAAVTSATGTGTRYLYATTSAATVANNNISIPSEVSNSKGTCGMGYLNVGTDTGNMTAATPNTSQASNSNTSTAVYYARYSQSLTNYYYGSSYTSRTLYRNQRVTGTSASSISAPVLNTTNTSTSDYTTAVGPGSSAWYGLSTGQDTTREYSSVSAAANSASTTLYTVYQFTISYSTSGALSGSISSIGATSANCYVTTSNTSCSVTLPTINVNSGYESLGWGTSSGHSGGTAAGSSYSVSSNNTTLYANAKSAVKTIANATYMQDVTSCPSTLTTGAQYTLKDSRDQKEYTVSKLADGKCWMTSNLNLAGGTVLSSDKSDVPSTNYYTLPNSSTSGFSSDTTAYVYNSNSTSCGNNSPCYSYYSWLAATAGGKDASGNAVASNGYNAAYSVCPKGWKLPTSTTSNAAANSNNNWKTGDWYAFAKAYGANLESNYYDSSATFYNNVNGGNAAGKSPVFLPLAGSYDNSSFYYGGSYGLYWSRTANSSSRAYALSFNSSYVCSADYYYRRLGFSVRCVWAG